MNELFFCFRPRSRHHVRSYDFLVIQIVLKRPELISFFKPQQGLQLKHLHENKTLRTEFYLQSILYIVTSTFEILYFLHFTIQVMDKSDLNCNRKLYMWRPAAMLKLNLSNSVEIQTFLPLWYSYVSSGSISQYTRFRSLQLFIRMHEKVTVNQQLPVLKVLDGGKTSSAVGVCSWARSRGGDQGGFARANEICREFPGVVNDETKVLNSVRILYVCFARLVFTSSRHFSGSGGDEQLSCVIV